MGRGLNLNLPDVQKTSQPISDAKLRPILGLDLTAIVQHAILRVDFESSTQYLTIEVQGSSCIKSITSYFAPSSVVIEGEMPTT